MTHTLKRFTPPAPIIARLIFAAIVGVLLVVFIGAEAGVGYGAITLVEAAKLSRTELQAGVVETFIINSPILDRAQLLEIQGNAYAYNEEATLPGVEFRAVNGTYTEATGTVNQKSETLVILGGDADVDRYIIQTRGNVNDQKAIQTELKVKAAALKFQDSFFNGDTGVDANSFDGLKKRLTGAQVITAGTNGLAIVGADSAARNLYFDQLDALIASVPGATPDNSAIYANDLVLAKHSSAARRETINADGADALGRSITTYRGFPMLDPGQRADGTRILPQTETVGASSVTSSAYLVKFGRNEAERATTVIYNGPPSVFDVRDLGELQTKPSERVRIEGFLGLALFGGKAAGRLQGLLNS
jgi:hypothetical protein